MTDTQHVSDQVLRLANSLIGMGQIPEDVVKNLAELLLRGTTVFGDDAMNPLRIALYDDPGSVETSEHGGFMREKAAFMRMLGRAEYVDSISKAAASIQDGTIAGDVAATEDTQRALQALKSSYDLGDASSPSFTISPKMDRESLSEVLKTADRSTGVRTGQVMDEWTVLLPGEIGIFVSMPSVGKTTKLVATGRGYCDNGPKGGAVFHFSEEMGLGPMVQKYVSSWKPKGNLIVKANPTGTSTVSYLDRVIDQNMQAGKFNAVTAILVDYAALLRASRNFPNKYDALAEIIVDLRGLGGKWKCPVWTASQPQRQPGRESRQSIPAAGAPPRCLGMSDVAECWAFSQVTDALISLNQTDAEREMDLPRVRVHAAKIRSPSAKFISRYTISTEVEYGRCMFRSIESSAPREAGLPGIR